jgi:hypothetical protein
VHFSCQERQKKEKNANIRSSTTIQPLSVYTCHTMCNRARLHIQLDDEFPNLATGKRHTRLLNGAGATHSLECEKHALATFQVKNNEYIVKILKRSHGPFNYTKCPCKNIKISPKAKFFFFFYLF